RAACDCGYSSNARQRWQGMSEQLKRQVFLCLAADGLPEAKMRQQNHDPHKEHACDRSAVQKQERALGGEYCQKDRCHHAACGNGERAMGYAVAAQPTQPGRRILTTRK